MKLNHLLAAALACVATYCQAQNAPAGLTFQGRLTTLSGQPVPNGTAKVRVRIFDAPSGGTRLWTSGEGPGQELTVPVRNGVFATVLSQGFNSSNNPLTFGPTVFQGGVIYVEVQPLNQTPIVPRTQIWSAPWAFIAETVPDGSITTQKLYFESVTTDKIAHRAVDANRLAFNSVLTEMIVDGAVHEQKLADGIVTAAKLAFDSGSLFKVSNGTLKVSGNYAEAVNSLYVKNNTTTNSLELTAGESQSQVMTIGNYPLKLGSAGNPELLAIHPDGTVTVNGATPGVANLSVNGVFQTTHANVIGDLNVYFHARKPGGGAWEDLSDARLKKNVRPIDGALETLLRIHGYSYEFKDPSIQELRPGKQLGFVAQQLETVFPGWVGETTEGHKTVALPNGFSALTVEAIRELKLENDRLRLRIRNLESERIQFSKLEQRLDRLENRTH